MSPPPRLRGKHSATDLRGHVDSLLPGPSSLAHHLGIAAVRVTSDQFAAGPRPEVRSPQVTSNSESGACLIELVVHVDVKETCGYNFRFRDHDSEIAKLFGFRRGRSAIAIDLGRHGGEAAFDHRDVVVRER